MNDLMYARFLGWNAIADKVLYSIIEQFRRDGEDEIMRMVDRGQISQEDAEDVLSDKYETVASRVPCEWKWTTFHCTS